MKMRDTIGPPFTNRFGCTPGPNYRRCRAVTKKGAQCRACAERGFKTCETHRKQEAEA